MKQGWEVKKLGEVCTILMGQSPSSDTYNDLGEGLPFFQGNADFGRIHPSVRVYCNAPIRIADVDDILISVRAPIGAINITNTKCCIGRGLAAIKNGNRIKKSFAYHALIANKDKLIALGTGSTFKSIGRIALNDLLIPIPPLTKQEKIVAELDCLSSIIEKKKQQLKEYDTLAQSIFYEMFGNPIDNEKGWEMCTIDSLCSSIVRGPFGSALKKEYFIEPTQTAYKVYEQKHAIQKNAEIGTYYISAERFATLSRFEVKAGDIIMSCSGTIGELFEIPIGAEKGLMNQALLKFTLNNRIEKIYFLFAMECVKDSFERKGTGLQNIGSVGTIKKTQISLPEITLQQEFASKIEAIEKQKELIKQSIAETETLFNSRMDFYFD